MEETKNNLVQIGLSKQEATVYLAALALGKSLHKTLAEKSGVKRPTLYDLLPGLKEKGLILETVIGKRKYLVPEDLSKFLELKKNQLERIEQDLPSLRALLATTSTKPGIEIYEGVEGVKKVWFDHLASKKPIYEVVGVENIKPELQKYIKQYYILERSKRRIPLQMLVSGPTVAGIFKVKSDPYEYREVRVIDGKLFPVPLGLDVYGDNVSITLHREESEPVGLIIRSKEISTSVLTLFKLAWQAGRGV